MPKEYKDLVVGLDIGTAKVMAVVGEIVNGSELRLVGLGVAESHGLKRGVVGVNTARAERGDDAAMRAGLQSGQIGGFATDVFRKEPPEPSPLLAHPRLIQTPHAGGFTEESVERATRVAVENLLRALEAG